LFFTFAIPYSPYTNDDDNNGSRPPTYNTTSKFSNGIHVKKNIEINLGWNGIIYDTMVVDSIVMTTCMSPFSKPLSNFDSMQKKSTQNKHAFLQMLLMHFYIR
jgi:hypothetical protein